MIADVIPDKLLQDIPLFRMLNVTERRQLAEIIRIKVYKPGDVIIEQGKECRNLWVVVEGKCEVVRHVAHKKSDEESIVLATLEPHEATPQVYRADRVKRTKSMRRGHRRVPQAGRFVAFGEHEHPASDQPTGAGGRSTWAGLR